MLTSMGWPSTNFYLLMALSIPCSWFDLLAGFSFFPRDCFCWGSQFCCSASTTIWNLDTASSMLLSSLWNLTIVLLSSHRTFLLSWVMSFSITIHYIQEFRRLPTSVNTNAKLADDEVGSTGYRYSSTPFQDVKVMALSSSVPHDRTYAYKASIFSGFLASYPPVGNTAFSFLILSLSLLSVSTVLPSSVILYGDLSASHFWNRIWRWWIPLFFSPTLLFLLLLSFMFSCFSLIENDKKTGSLSDVLGSSLDLCWTIISSLNCYPRRPLTKALFLVMIEALIVCMNGH